MSNEAPSDSGIKDSHGISRFEQEKIDDIIDGLGGLDKTIYDYLNKERGLSPSEKRMLSMEVMVSERPFVNVAQENGFIKHDKVVELSLIVNPEELANKELIEPSIPYSVFLENKIMLNAVNDDTVYLATLSSKYVTEEALKPYYKGHKFYFTPANIKQIGSYLKRLEVVYQDKGTLLDALIRKAVREKISDIHILPTRAGYSMSTRFLGELYPERVGDDDEYYSLIAKLKLESSMDVSERRKPQSGGYPILVNGRSIDLRVEVCPNAIGKESAVIRILDPENSNTPLAALGITEIDEWLKAIRAENGIVLVCGTTGSGKSTTIASTIISGIDRFSKSIISIEDPVEAKIPGIKQVNVNPNAGLTFSAGLRSAMRKDPDIIWVGEIRDTETMQIAMQAAETGHLLVSSLHTKDIQGTIDRLEGLGAEKEKLVDLLRGILVQKLMRVVCLDCQGAGCDKCNKKGFTGRTVVSECVYFNSPKEVRKMMECKGEFWWNTKLDDAYNKYKKGITLKTELVKAFGEEAVIYLRERDEWSKEDEINLKGGPDV
jgi:Tfp pilus assembly pilus retraction ATPase PilT